MDVIIYLLINFWGSYKWIFLLVVIIFVLTATSKQWVCSFQDKVSVMFIFIRNSRMLMEGSNLINFVMPWLKSCSSNSFKLCWILFNVLIFISELLFLNVKKTSFHIALHYTHSPHWSCLKNTISFHLIYLAIYQWSFHSIIQKMVS